jgi:hypothetical protein
MRRAKLRAISRMYFPRLAPLHRLRRRAARTADFDSTLPLNAGNATPNLGVIEDDYSMVIGIFPGFGTYWECQIVIEGKQQLIRSYKLDPLIGEVIKALWEYERLYG